MFNTRKAEVQALRDALDDACKLRTIVRNGRMIIFTFERKGKFFTIETMGMLSDNIDNWKVKAGV